MQENNLKGLWIHYEILTNEHLSDKEKHIYSLILFFSKNCHTIIIDKSTIEEYLEKDYIELNGMKMYCPTE